MKCFDSEYKCLLQQKNLKHLRSSSILTLSPFLDDKGIIRVGGRLKMADVPFDAKHQILLPHKHAVTKLIIKDAHDKLTESILRQKIWITNSQRTIKSVIHGCINCFKINPKPMTQYMSHLPANRVTANQKPFTNTAVDYTGAIKIKMTNGRGFRSTNSFHFRKGTLLSKGYYRRWL